MKEKFKILIIIITVMLIASGLILKCGIYYNVEPVTVFKGTVISHSIHYNKISINVKGRKSFFYNDKEIKDTEFYFSEMAIWDEWFVLNTDDGDYIVIWTDKKGFYLYQRIDKLIRGELVATFECKSKKFYRYLEKSKEKIK